MKALIVAALGAAAVGLAPLTARVAQPTPRSVPAAPLAPPAPIVFFDIAGPADAHLAAFYDKVFGWQGGPGQTIAPPVSGPVLHGTLRTDPAQKIIYVGVPDVRATLKDIEANGGKVVTPRFEVKGVAVIGLFTDPAGNAMGLVELGPDGKVRVP